MKGCVMKLRSNFSINARNFHDAQFSLNIVNNKHHEEWRPRLKDQSKILVTFSTTPCVQTVKVVYRKKDLKSLVGIAARKIIICFVKTAQDATDLIAVMVMTGNVRVKTVKAM